MRNAAAHYYGFAFFHLPGHLGDPLLLRNGQDESAVAPRMARMQKKTSGSCVCAKTFTAYKHNQELQAVKRIFGDGASRANDRGAV
jgi:hypothetical protein